MGIWRAGRAPGVLPSPSRGRGARGRRPVPARRRGGGAGARMNIGIPTEIKPDERRVALTPAGAREFTRRGHRVLVQRGAGSGSGFSDDAYLAVGAEWRVDDVFAEARADPQGQGAAAARRSSGCPRSTRCSPTCTSPPTRDWRWRCRERRALHRLRDGRGRAGRLPLLRPMSEIAGRLAAQAGAAALTGPGRRARPADRAACRASRRPRCWSSAAASPGPRRRSSPPAWARA